MKEKLFKTTIILLIGGLLTKLLGMLIKISLARTISPKALGLYMMILPTFNLVIQLSQLSLPLAISKIVSEGDKNSKKLYFSVIPILIITNILVIGIILMFGRLISINLLHEEKLIPAIYSLSAVIPFITISSICRSYFFAKQKMIPHVTSNIIENIVRLLLILLILPKLDFLSLKYKLVFLILSNIISELTSTIILLINLPKNITIKKEDLKPNKNYIKESLSLSIPNTTDRLVGSIAYFLEPIILTKHLLKNYSKSWITQEYGIFTGFVMPLLLLPSFFTIAISNALLPEISKDYYNKLYKTVKRKIKTSVLISFLIGLIPTLFFIIKPTIPLKFLYKTTKGTNYIRLLAPICLIEYLNSPISSSLIAMGKSKECLKISIISSTLRLITLSILSNFKIGFISLILSISIDVITDFILGIKEINKHL